MTLYQLSSNKYRQINTNKYSILINKNSLIKSITFKYKLCAYIKAIKKNVLITYKIKISSKHFLANNNLNQKK